MTKYSAPGTTITSIDLFAGGGGASHGIRGATGVSPAIAVDHDPAAIAMHSANHPETTHLCESVFDVSPCRPGGRLDLLWLSPSCTGHSRARGVRPLDAEDRALADIAIPWAEKARPTVIILENVSGWLDWGPLGADGRPIKARKGEFYRAWCRKIEALGYSIEHRILAACDYGAPTTRRRLFLVARCDGRPIVWPKPTHGPGLIPYRTAAECIDWSIPCPSIFLTPAEVRASGLRCRRPLAANTLARIAEGVRRYVLEDADPLIAPVIIKGRQGALVAAFLVAYYGSEKHGQSLHNPLRTIPTVDRFGLVTVDLDGEPWTVSDIGMRMLQPRELATAQGFPADYILTGSKAEQVGRIGNSVSPMPARALVEAQFLSGAA